MNGLDWVRDIVRKRSGDSCEKCGTKLIKGCNGKGRKPHSRTIHHRRPQRLGGRDRVANLVNLCFSCHKAIHEDEEAAVDGGWIVLVGDPGRVPLQRFDGWCLLQVDGGLTRLDFSTNRAEVGPAKRVKQRPRRTRKVLRPA